MPFLVASHVQAFRTMNRAERHAKETRHVPLVSAMGRWDLALLGVQALLLLATVAQLRRAPPANRERRKKRQAVRLGAEDRQAAAAPLVAPLRPAADPRADGAQLLRCAPLRPSGAAVLLLPGGNYDSCARPPGKGPGPAEVT